MSYGYVRAAAVTPELKVADVAYNTKKIEEAVRAASEGGARIIVLPELCITGYSCGDLFFQSSLIEAARKGLIDLTERLSDVDGIIFLGLPLFAGGKLYNVAAAISYGQVLGFIPKSNIPSYNEFYEDRQFCAAPEGVHFINVEGIDEVPFGTEILFTTAAVPGLSIAAEICEDLWVPAPPSVMAAKSGATVIVNLSASDALVGKGDYLRSLIEQQSARLYVGYVYACAGADESTQDLVFAGHDLIAENGRILAEKTTFENGVIFADIDIEAITARRRQTSTYKMSMGEGFFGVPFSMEPNEGDPDREYPSMPFVPSDPDTLTKRCEEILSIQAYGLRKRLIHTGCKKAVIGISGGLDSTLALLVTVRAFKFAGLDPAGIIAVTMPGFGTTDRTHDNAVRMCESLAITTREINICASVKQHFSDIGQDEDNHDVTYENSQARERTQILMDIANMEGALVVGTGDLSELALGWATYNGDHMSMYGVNGSVPKTLVRHLVRYYADHLSEDAGLTDILHDILDTPVSPELLPPKDGVISQCTEDIVGPYELHDFFLYYMMRYGFSPKKIFMLACMAFAGDDRFDKAEILKWEKIFYRRFFAQQFKRSCIPDGPKVGTVSLSPRGDLRMPSDASGALWMAELEDITL